MTTSILNLKQVQWLSGNEYSERVVKTVRTKEIENLTYYLDEMNNGTFVITQDEYPVEICLNESVAVKRFEEITS